MRILLLYANPNQSVPVSPYGLDAIAGALRIDDRRADLCTVNPFIEDVDHEGHLRAVLERYDPDLIALSIRNIDNAIVAISGDAPPDGSPVDLVPYAPDVRRLVRVIKEWDGEVACVAGGSGFTACPAEFLDYLDLDHGLVGATEASFVRLVRELSGSRPPYGDRVSAIMPGLPGAIVREGAGFRTVPGRPLSEAEPGATLDIAPEYQLLYRLRGIPVAVRTKTGCPLRCSYCTDPINMRRTGHRPLRNVIAEIGRHVDEHGLTEFHIADAELNLPYEDHLLRFCGALRDSGLADRIRWRGYFNVIPFSDDLLKAIVSTGCRSPSFAVDSFNEEGLRAHRKNFRAHHVHDLLDRILAYGSSVRPEVCLLMGGPGETTESIDTNIRWMLHYADRGVRFSYSCGLRVYPNTPLALAPLEARHVYLPSGRDTSKGTRLFSPGELLRETVAYCEPLAPRELVRYIDQRVRGHPNISVFADWPWPEVRHGEALRHFNVGVHRMANGRFDEASGLLGEALTRNPDLTVARTALNVIDSVAARA